jgi:hypothetical protein
MPVGVLLKQPRGADDLVFVKRAAYELKSYRQLLRIETAWHAHRG